MANRQKVRSREEAMPVLCPVEVCSHDSAAARSSVRRMKGRRKELKREREMEGWKKMMMM